MQLLQSRQMQRRPLVASSRNTSSGDWRRAVFPYTRRCRRGRRRSQPKSISHMLLGALSSRKNSISHIDASLSRQPLVKGERLVRYEVNAVMAQVGPPGLASGLAASGPVFVCAPRPRSCWAHAMRGTCSALSECRAHAERETAVGAISRQQKKR